MCLKLKIKKSMFVLVVLFFSVILYRVLEGSSSSTETSSAGSTDSIYWQNFANDDGASYSTSNSLPTGFSVGSAQLKNGTTSYSSPLVYLDDDGTQYLIILEIDGTDLYLNKYAYSGSSLTYDETLATFDADGSNFASSNCDVYFQ